jgi:hypothetical protein
MPTAETLRRFIDKVLSNAHDEAIREFYSEHASIRENQSEPRRGRNNLVAREISVLARAKRVTSTCVQPVFQEGDLIVIRWIFRFDWLDGTTTEMEEIAYQRWADEKIVEEQFFYDPSQREPKRT